MNKFFFNRLVLLLFLMIAIFPFVKAQSKNTGIVLHFRNTANDKPLKLLDSAYVNAFDEAYQLTKLKYYISNIRLAGNASKNESKAVFLIDAAAVDTISFKLKPGTYTQLSFTLGVDSAFNCSGAQAGALDPMNGMFWTWNSGYVFFKMEGYSAASTADLQRIEHHVGGYQGSNKASRKIELVLPEPLIIRENESHKINIKVDLDKYWKGKNEIKISANALIMVPGELAKQSADNFTGMFSIAEVK